MTTEIVKNVAEAVQNVFIKDERYFSISAPVGCGVISQLKEEAARRGVEFREVRLGCYLPGDVQGIPYLGPDGEVVSAPFDAFGAVKLNAVEPAIVLFDEISNAALPVAKAFSELSRNPDIKFVKIVHPTA